MTKSQLFIHSFTTYAPHRQCLKSTVSLDHGSTTPKSRTKPNIFAPSGSQPSQRTIKSSCTEYVGVPHSAHSRITYHKPSQNLASEPQVHAIHSSIKPRSLNLSAPIYYTQSLSPAPRLNLLIQSLLHSIHPNFSWPPPATSLLYSRIIHLFCHPFIIHSFHMSKPPLHTFLQPILYTCVYLTACGNSQVRSS